MQFIKHDLGHLSGSETVEVSITSAANVRLLDSDNLRKYRYGRVPSFDGGHYDESPVVFEIPRSGHWYVVVDLGGRAGEITSSFRVISKEAVAS